MPTAMPAPATISGLTTAVVAALIVIALCPLQEEPVRQQRKTPPDVRNA